MLTYQPAEPALSTPSLPVLDFSHFHAAEPARQAFLDQLRRAAHEIGFFYLTGHGIDPALQQQVLAVSRQFFNLPAAAKHGVSMVNSPHFRGYTRIGSELTLGKQDWREQFDLMEEAIALSSIAKDQPWLQLQGPNQWPAALPTMRGIVLTWQESLRKLSQQLLQAFALALGQPATAFDASVAEGAFQHLKLIRYPGREQTRDDQGVGAHKDAGYLTLVLQDEQAGLEVLLADDWQTIAPMAGSFVVNIGELLELASSGYLRATLHRVVTPPAGVERYSCAYFMAAHLNATVPVLPLPGQLALAARGPQQEQHNALYYEVGRNILKGRLRSHPDVAAVHYGTQQAQSVA